RRALVHVHCHEKALVGTDPVVLALELIADLSVEVVQSACCGMAGSFGYEAEHFEVSRAMAERDLVPAVDAAPDDVEVLVTGVSCRQQLDQFAEKRSRHVAELLAAALR
ncbi:MAG: FAD-binding oxidoreductase, partial [Dehalococcoidia bacterium]